MRVKNLNGTSGKTCSCGSWTDHWDNYGGAVNWPQWCAVKDCKNDPEVGAHVKMVGVGDHKHYIVLMCRAHNNQFGQELELESYVKPAWANIRGTCTPGFSW